MQRCVELGMPALALTDHGNMFGAINFYRAAKKAGIKPIIGCEIYLVHDHKQAERPKRDRNRSDDIDDLPEGEAGPEHFPPNQIHHKTILAKDFTGYQNLVKLVSDAHLNGQYYRPRCDMETLAAHSEGLIGLSGCLNGVAAQHLIYNNYQKAREVTAQFLDIFGKENYFIEVHNHGMPIQKKVLPNLLKLAKEFDLPVVAANDVHYVMREDWQPHDALLCIQTGKYLEDEDRMRYPNQEFYLKSRAEMTALFPECPEAIDNTLRVAEMVDLELKFFEDHYPVFEKAADITYAVDRAEFDRVLDIYVAEKNKVLIRQEKEPIALTKEERDTFATNGTYLLDLCKQGLQERYGVDYDAVKAEQRAAAEPTTDRTDPREGLPDLETPAGRARLVNQMDYELAIIVGAGFVDYFLITWDFIDWARQQGIPVGPGRGSGAGCIVAYVLKITDIDPIGGKLLFERMLSLERVSPPDFDVDFCMRRRDDVVNYVRHKYGEDRVANIITYGTFGAKAVVRDLARVMSVPYADANRIAKMVPDDLNISLEKALEKSQELQAEKRQNQIVDDILKQGEVIEGMVRNTGKHACGIIIGDQPLTNLVPLTLQEGDLTTQYAKGPVEDLGMLKADFLGLKTLTVLSDAQDHVRRSTGQPQFEIEKVPFDDAPTYALLNSGRTTGVFQLESGGMQALCRQIGLETFEEVSDLIALYRPGPMQFIPQYVKGKKDPSTIKVPHELVRDIVEPTYGVMVYQEQVMQVAQVIAGFTLGESDILRRAMGKKIASLMAEQKVAFVKGADRTHGIKAREAEEIFEILEKFASYGFNKSHSAAYAVLSYRTAYLKANYPVQFMAAVLGCELGNSDKLAHAVEECLAMGLTVLGPDVNESRENFTPVVRAQARVNSDQSKDRSPDTGYQSTTQSAIRFGLAAIKGVGEGPAQAIIAEREKGGPFQDMEDFVTRVDAKLANRRVLEALIRSGAFEALGEDRGTLLHHLEAIMKEVQDLRRDAEMGQGNMFDMLMETPDTTATGSAQTAKRAPHPMSESERLSAEKELLGFYVSGHPMDDFADLAEALDTFTGDEYQRMESRERFRLCAVITGVAKKISRRDNRQWAILNVANRRHAYEMNVYADAYESYNAHCIANTRVMIEGQVVRRADGEVQLTIDNLAPLETAIMRSLQRLRFVIAPDAQGAAFLARLRKEAQDNFGQVALDVAFPVSDTDWLLAEANSSLTWKPDMARYKALLNDPAVQRVVAVEVKPPSKPEAPKWARREG